MKAIIKKLNDFKLTSIIACGIQLLAGISALLLLLAYGFAFGVQDDYEKIVTSFDSKPIAGMIFFLLCVLAIIVSIAIIYQLFPLIIKKTKIKPVKWPFLVSVLNFVLLVALFVFSIFALKEKPYVPELNPLDTVGLKTAPLYVIGMIFGLISALGSLACLFPYIFCDFKVKESNEAKPQ